MVFVPFIHSLSAVKHHTLPDGIVPGYSLFERLSAKEDWCPDAVCLEVGLIYHIQAEPVAEFINRRVVGIVTCADSVDIVTFHGHNIRPELVKIRNSSGDTAEFVAVYALKDDPLSV